MSYSFYKDVLSEYEEKQKVNTRLEARFQAVTVDSYLFDDVLLGLSDEESEQVKQCWIHLRLKFDREDDQGRDTVYDFPDDDVLYMALKMIVMKRKEVRPSKKQKN